MLPVCHSLRYQIEYEVRQLLKPNLVFHFPVAFPQTWKDPKTEMEKVTDKACLPCFLPYFCWFKITPAKLISFSNEAVRDQKSHLLCILRGAGKLSVALGAFFSMSLFSFAQIYSRGELHHFIDGFNEEKSNWLRYVNPAHSAREQNLAACQNGMNIYFYTIKPIPANQELLVWYCRDFAERLHYPYPGELTMMNLSKWITEKKKLKMLVMSVLPPLH